MADVRTKNLPGAARAKASATSAPSKVTRSTLPEFEREPTRGPGDHDGFLQGQGAHVTSKAGHVATGFELGGARGSPPVEHAFERLDATAAASLATLAKAFAAPELQAVLGTPPHFTKSDLTSMGLHGTLRGQSLATVAPALAGALGEAANFLRARPNAAFLAQLSPSKGITAEELASARLAGFSAPHAAMLKEALTAFAKSAAAVTPGDTAPEGHAFTLAEVTTLAAGGACPDGQELAAAIPDSKARQAFQSAAALIAQNPAVFRQLDLSGPGMANMAMTNGKFTATDINRLLGANGLSPLPHRPTFDALVKATLPQVVKPFTRPVEIHDVDQAKRAELARLYTAWADETGMVAHHQAWHSENGSGGTKGKGSGEKFLQFHAQMGEEFRQYLLDQKPPRTDLFDANGNLPTWDTLQPLPKEFWEGTVKHQIDWRLPGFLSPEPRKGETFTLDGRTITCLNDIKSPDELGRVWGESGAHAVAHNQLGAEMAGFASVRDPAFLLWHFGVIETNRAEWLDTESGKAWTAAHPSGWTDPFADAGKVKSPPRGIALGAKYPQQPRGPFWTDDQIREAGVGFVDPAKRRAASDRVATTPRAVP
ncbi:MAG: hypothetical protein K1X89_09870 [Myxococcaceae bacterium]|nr:hypothetical protein [Myxococcaceae bacterium]